MFSTPEQLAATNKAAIEALLTIATASFSSAEKLASLNVNVARNLLEESIANTKTLFSAKDPQELAALQASLAQPALEKSVAYARNVYEIATQAQEEITKVIEAQMADANSNMASALDKAAKSAPAGSDVAVAAVKSALAAANSAYDNMSKAAKQVTEMAEANVAAATTATVKAAKASSGKKAV